MVKDTGDVVEEVLVLKTPLVTNFVHCLQEESLSLWPVVLQKDDHMTQRQVISAALGEHSQLKTDSQRLKARSLNVSFQIISNLAGTRDDDGERMMYCVGVYFEARQHELQTEGQNVFASAGNKPQVVAYKQIRKQETALKPHPVHYWLFS